MIGAYCNMSVPPRTTMEKEVKFVGRRVVFSLSFIGLVPASRQQGRAGISDASQNAKYAAFLEAFERDHGDELAAAPRPAGYVIATKFWDVHFNIDRDACYIDCDICDDTALTIAVVSRIAGGIYIPRRRPAICRDNAGEFFLLPVSVFPEKAKRLFHPEGMGKVLETMSANCKN